MYLAPQLTLLLATVARAYVLAIYEGDDCTGKLYQEQNDYDNSCARQGAAFRSYKLTAYGGAGQFADIWNGGHCTRGSCGSSLDSFSVYKNGPCTPQLNRCINVGQGKNCQRLANNCLPANSFSSVPVGYFESDPRKFCYVPDLVYADQCKGK